MDIVPPPPTLKMHRSSRYSVSDKSTTLQAVVDDHQQDLDAKEILLESADSQEKEKVHYIQSVDQWKKLKSSHTFTIAMMTALWCSPATRVSPFYNDLAAQYQAAGRVVFTFVDVDEMDDTLASEYNISMMPTFVVIKDGEEVDRYSGSDAARLRKMVERHLEDSAGLYK